MVPAPSCHVSLCPAGRGRSGDDRVPLTCPLAGPATPLLLPLLPPLPPVPSPTGPLGLPKEGAQPAPGRKGHGRGGESLGELEAMGKVADWAPSAQGSESLFVSPPSSLPPSFRNSLCHLLIHSFTLSLTDSPLSSLLFTSPCSGHRGFTHRRSNQDPTPLCPPGSLGASWGRCGGAGGIVT